MSCIKRFIEDEIYSYAELLKDFKLTKDELVSLISAITEIPIDIVNSYLGENF